MKKKYDLLISLHLKIILSLASTALIAGCSAFTQREPFDSSTLASNTIWDQLPPEVEPSKEEPRKEENWEETQAVKEERSGETASAPAEPAYIYYSLLSDLEKQIYDAMLLTANSPDLWEKGLTVPFNISAFDERGVFDAAKNRAWSALSFDHPELFWLFYSPDPEISIQLSGFHEPDESGQWPVTFKMTKALPDQPALTADFEEAADSFMADIDTSGQDAYIALQIHDKLISLVEYDTDLWKNHGDVRDYGYSAYGALVENSRGGDHLAVCQGYASAFEYLCQKAGITCTLVCGQAAAGETQPEGHTWNLIQLDDGCWYEVDATWDDISQKVIDEAATSDSDYTRDWIYDSDYLFRVRHYLYAVDTNYISNFRDSESYKFETDNGWYIPMFNSVHIRDESDFKLPRAEGGIYAHGSLP